MMVGTLSMMLSKNDCSACPFQGMQYHEEDNISGGLVKGGAQAFKA